MLKHFSHWAAATVLFAAGAAHADIFITEVYPSGSSNATYGSDWFELTNTGTSAVDITGWKVDDSSNAFATALPLLGVTSISAGGSAIFFEGNSSGDNHETKKAAFKAAWFGADVPAGFLIGSYGGSGIGLSSGGDGVNIFDAAGVPQAGIDFGATTTGFSFDNAIGSSGTISTLSVAGTNGAFVSFDGLEVGSPGVVASAAPVAVPEPASIGVLVIGGLALLRRRRVV